MARSVGIFRIVFTSAIRALCRDLQVLRNEGQAVFFGDGAPVPIHKRRIELDDFFAVGADDVPFKRSRVARAFVVLEIASDIEFRQNAGANQIRERTIDGGAGNFCVLAACGDEQILRSKMPFVIVGNFPNGESGLSISESDGGENFTEIQNGGRIFHVSI